MHRRRPAGTCTRTRHTATLVRYVYPRCLCALRIRVQSEVADTNSEDADGTTDDAWDGPAPAWSVHARTLHAAHALPYAPTKWCVSCSQRCWGMA